MSMSKTRRKHSAEFKAKVVLEMLQGSQTLSEIAGKYGIHPTQLTKWRRTFLDRASELFSEPGSGKDNAGEKLEEELYKKIGKQQIELDWLKKKSGISL